MMGKARSKILVTGGTGFIGRHLCATLLERDYDVIVLTRNTAPAKPGIATFYVNSLEDIDSSENLAAIVNLAGEPLDKGRWNAARKAVYGDSRVGMTEAVGRLIQRLESPPEVLVSGSAIGWYGHWDDEELDETASARDCYAHRLCADWEAAAQLSEGLTRVCITRIGVVLGRDGGPLSPMLLPGRLGLGGPMGSGQQWWSWIHVHDLVRLFIRLIEDNSAVGVYNGTAPEPVRQGQLAKALGKQLRRPAFMPLPAFAARLMLGEFADEILLKGQRVVPNRALERGFQFNYPTIQQAFADLLP